MNRLRLAVAGGRKTQSIIEHCREASEGRRILVLTYTVRNQLEISNRLAPIRPLAAHMDVLGWFGFLIRHWIGPYLPCRFAGRRVAGLNFPGDPGQYARGEARYLDADGRAYMIHLAKLAIEVQGASGDSVLERLSRIYHEIHIDEAQDLTGWDLEVLAELLKSRIDVHMVGDLRQALLSTNPRDPKNSQFKGLKIKHWFDECQRRGLLDIEHQTTTWRSNQMIASFADAIFDPSWGFGPTTARNDATCGHDGLFAVDTGYVREYLRRYAPLCLRHSANSAKTLSLPFVNIGVAKGMSADHVLIAPTGPMIAYLRKQTQLADTPCCSLYVAVTRARHSVAFVSDNPDALGLPVWTL